jgi:hypothetical protein
MKTSPLAVLTSKPIWIAGSHVAMLLLGYMLLKENNTTKAQSNELVANASVSTSSSSRSRTRSDNGDGGLLLEAFLAEKKDAVDLYEEYKKSLSPAADKKQALFDAMDAILQVAEMGGSDQKKMRELGAVVRVRYYQWMMEDPLAAHQGIKEYKMKLPDTSQLSSQVYEWFKSGTDDTVIADVLKQKGLLNSLSWLQYVGISQQIVVGAFASEVKEQGGMSNFLRLEREFRTSYEGSNELMMQMFDETSYMRIAAELPVSDAQALLDYVSSSTNEDKNRAMLVGFASSNKEAATWLLDQIAKGTIPQDYATSVAQGLGHQVLTFHDMNLDARIAARRYTQGNEKKDRDSIVGELMQGDVNAYLTESRDWRFEFRHGNASLDEITAAMEKSLNIPADGRDAAMISLYRNLAEENPAKALPLLNALPEDKRRSLLFADTWQNFGNINPNNFFSYLQSLPEPLTAQEKSDRMKGWDWKARGFLHRYGDDYITWAKSLPDGPDKAAALNSVIWATREINAVEAQRLSKEIYAK